MGHQRKVFGLAVLVLYLASSIEAFSQPPTSGVATATHYNPFVFHSYRTLQPVLAEATLPMQHIFFWRSFGAGHAMAHHIFILGITQCDITYQR
jgi:hypothetical protein